MGSTDFILEEELKKLPDAPGVYIMHDATDQIIYVGKAVSLTKRVHQYFQASHDEGVKKRQMVERISWFEYIVTDSELEALVLENNLIKEHRPKYNTLLRDDKTYPYIKVTLQEAYPRILFVRRVKRDGAKYYGPFSSAEATHQTIELVQKLYRIRTCNRKLPENIGKDRPCLNYHMKQCDAPCDGKISREDYMAHVHDALRFLDGDTGTVSRELTARMNDAAAAMDFERAAEYRDLLKAIEHTAQRQKITRYDEEDLDVIAAAIEGEDAVVSVFYIRAGKMIGRDHFAVNVRADEGEKEVLGAFVHQFYAGTPFIPREICLPIEIDDSRLTQDWLSDKRGQRVYLRYPRRGKNARLIDLAAKNAQMIMNRDREKIKRQEGRTIGAMRQIAQLLGLERVERMEAYDISHIMGFATVGSMVVFERGKAKRSDYRKFRLKTIEGPDDYASMREVLTRRFRHGMEEKEKLREKQMDEKLGAFTKFPDILMMDGGKGQVHIAEEVLRELKLDIPVAGMVKDDHHNTRGIYFHDRELPIDKSSEGFQLISRLQDEAHRFAISYHKSLRSAAQVHSFLDDIPGIGPARRKALMRRFDDAQAMAAESVEDLAAIDGMNRTSAQAVWDFLHRH